jgi:hypothetical protein
VNLIANTDFTFMLFVALIILRTGMRVDLILIGSLQCDRFDHIFDRFFVLKKILVRILICTNRLEEIQEFFSRLMLNDSDVAKHECSSLVCAKKFMNEDDIIIECVSQFLIDHFDSEIFSFADSLLDFCLDEESF